MDAALLAQAGATHRRAPKLSFPSARVRSVLRLADHHHDHSDRSERD